MIDVHCHLTDGKLIAQIEDVLERAREAGVKKIIVPGLSLDDSQKVVDLVDRYDQVYGLVGIHPEEIVVGGSPRYARDDVGKLKEMVGRNKKIVGIGEIGLENYAKTQKIENSKAQENMKQQKTIFKKQLELAVKLNLPVVIHCREAEEEMRQALEEMDVLPRGQFHCFGESDSFLEYVLKKGFYVSFCGNITYKSAVDLRKLIKMVPLDKLLLETDSPYLAPLEKRGLVNEPSNVKIIAEYIAELLGMSLETLINQTTANTKCLFFAGW